MAEALIVGAAVGAAFSDLYTVVKSAVLQVAWCHEYCQVLLQILDMHHPIFLQICSNLQTPLSEWEQCYLLGFSQKLGEGKLLVESCLQLRFGWMNAFSRIRYSRQILKLREDILLHLQQLPALNTLQLQQINTGLHDVREQRDKDHAEVMGALKSDNPIPATEWVRQLAAAVKTDEHQKQGNQLDELIHQDQILVGVDAHVEQVKSLLLSDNEDKMIMIVEGMGGIGKTTLAVSVCKDRQVRDFFEDRIHFVTVSQSPDMKSLLRTIWNQVVGEPVPLFQTMEDAYRQLKGKLLSIVPSKRRLLVLDDVWSKAHLENLSFEVEGLKTMITTRQAPTLQTRHSHRYRLDLLNETDAESLFCYWAFGQFSIPTWVEEPQVVKEVISECKGLPLALKVIGSSLSSTVGQSPAAYWRAARDKLRDAKPLGEYQKDVLLGQLQTSIDALDPMLRECFLDLGAHPEDQTSTADFLLDIWVYVRGMEWVDAVLALVELGSRSLIEFSGSSTSVDIWRAIESNSADDLKFSQHDVLRDLALQLGAITNHPPYSPCKRLLMPQPGKSIPNAWQSEEAAMAEVISIHAGLNMREEDWPIGLAFPHARALLLQFEGHGEGNHLPPFLSSMCNLKVMYIRTGGVNFGRHRIGSSTFGDFVELQSMKLQGEYNLPIVNQPKLEKLRFRECCELHEIVGEFSALTYLSFSNCYNLEKLPLSFCNLSNLHTLVLNSCARLRHLSARFGLMVALKKLDLSWCTNLEDLTEDFGCLVSLEILILFECHSLKELPQSFVRLNKLKELRMSVCSGLKKFPEISNGQLGDLKRLDLSFCSSLEKLPESFGNLRGLEDLSLKFLGLQRLPESFGQLGGPRTLKVDLSHCFSLEKLPESFGNLRGLEYLSLAGCRSLKELPRSFVRLNKLKELMMRGCDGLKNLPEISNGQLRDLKQLNLRDCSSLEKLPESFGNLRGLESLSLEECFRFKHLPESFGQLSGLRTLKMGGVYKMKSLPAAWRDEVRGAGGLVPLLGSLESVTCDESLVLHWKALYPPGHALPTVKLFQRPVYDHGECGEW